ncbi:hypothetical protein J4E91_009144 [Alternaria rosae]|nr:hypothetical protein J4E91_009144 [Alternaria rosae]
MAKSKFLSVSAQKKADKLAAQASELAFYNVLLCTAPEAPQTPAWNKVAGIGKDSVGIRIEDTRPIVSRVAGPWSGKTVESTMEHREAPNLAANSTATLVEVLFEQSKTVAKEPNEWITIQHKQTRTKSASEQFESKTVRKP